MNRRELVVGLAAIAAAPVAAASIGERRGGLGAWCSIDDLVGLEVVRAETVSGGAWVDVTNETCAANVARGMRRGPSSRAIVMGRLRLTFRPPLQRTKSEIVEQIVQQYVERAVQLGATWDPATRTLTGPV